jgi:hypothetical protein
MTSLIFYTTYLGYKKAVAHKHNKRKQVNYERWEDLRDTFDDEAKRRSSLNLDDRPASRGGLSPWDERLPANLKVERKSYDESSMRRPWDENRLASETRSQRTASESRSPRNMSEESLRRSPSASRKENYNIEPELWHTPGGMMAELIEGGK